MTASGVRPDVGGGFGCLGWDDFLFFGGTVAQTTGNIQWDPFFLGGAMKQCTAMCHVEGRTSLVIVQSSLGLVSF